MAAYRLPAVKDLPKLSQSERDAILDHLFEPSPQLRELCAAAFQEAVYRDFDDFILRVKAKLEELLHSPTPESTARLDEILSSHPRLGEKNVTSQQSQAEQAQLQGQDDHEAQMLRRLNASYEETFPSLRYVVFVDGRSRSDILEDIQYRIASSNMEQERKNAIAAMCAIASNRAHKLIQS